MNLKTLKKGEYTAYQLLFNWAGILFFFALVTMIVLVILTKGDIQPTEGISWVKWLIATAVGMAAQYPIRALLNKHIYSFFNSKYDVWFQLLIWLVSFFVIVQK